MILGDFELRELRARGRFGPVYEALQRALNRPVLVRIVDAARDRAAILSAARRAAGLDHPHLVPVYGAGDSETGPWIAFRRIDGRRFDSWASGSPPLAEALERLAETADALAAAHAAGLVHGHVEASQILVADDLAHLAGLGLASQRTPAPSPADDFLDLGRVLAEVAPDPPPLVQGILEACFAGEVRSAGDLAVALRRAARDPSLAGRTASCVPPAEATPPKPDAPPRREPAPSGRKEIPFGKFVLLDLLGRGGYGAVYRAYQRDLDRHVALKLQMTRPDDDAEAGRKFLAEARAAAALRHPNIVPIHEVGETEGRRYFTMELVDGPSLGARIRESGPLPNREAASIVRDAARAVEHAHESRVVHRDLKPENILLDRTGRVLVTDFGLARRLQAEGVSASASGEIVGTPAYMSPEQARGERRSVGPRSDVYSLGAVLYCLLTGRPPYEGESPLQIVLGVLHRDPPEPRRIRPAVHPDLQTICLKAMERDPDRRYPSAGNLADDLQRYLDGEPIQAAPPSTGYRLRRFLARRKGLVAAVAALLAISAASLAFVARTGARDAARERARTPLQNGRRLLEQMRLYQRQSDWKDDDLAELSTRARDEFKKVLAEVPDHSEAMLGMGQSLALIGHDDKALEWFDLAVQKAPGFATPYLERVRSRVDDYERFRHESGGKVRAETDEARRIRESVESDLATVERFSILKEEKLYGRALLAFGRGDYAEAADLLKGYLDIAPADGRTFLWRGHALYHLERWADAEASLRRAIECNPRDPNFRGYLAMVLSGKGDLEAALREYDATIKLAPRHAAYYVNRGNVRKRRREYEAAIRDYDLALKIGPPAPDAYTQRGICHDALGKLGPAMEDYEAALNLRPDYVLALAKKSSMLFRLNRIREALACADAAVKADPGEALAYGYRSQAREKLGDLDGALADAEQAVAREPQAADAWARRASVRAAKGDATGSELDFVEALKRDPECWNAYYYRGLARFRRKDFAGALADFEASIRVDPKAAGGWLNRAVLRQRSGDSKGALADFDEAVRVFPEFEPGWVERGRLKLEMGDAAGAKADAEKGIELDPKSAAAWVVRGLARERLGDREGARADYDKAVETDPKHANAWTNRGVLKAESGDLEGAIGDFTEAIQLLPGESQGYVNRAVTYIQLRRFEEAWSDIEKARGVDERDPEMWYYRALLRDRSGDRPGAVEDLRRALAAAPVGWMLEKAAKRMLEQLGGRE